METRANYAVIGAFTLAIVAGAFAFVFWFSGGEKPLGTHDYKIVFNGSIFRPRHRQSRRLQRRARRRRVDGRPDAGRSLESLRGHPRRRARARAHRHQGEARIHGPHRRRFGGAHRPQQRCAGARDVDPEPRGAHGRSLGLPGSASDRPEGRRARLRHPGARRQDPDRQRAGDPRRGRQRCRSSPTRSLPTRPASRTSWRRWPTSAVPSSRSP